jgi:disulfide bond formation protein DsbB
MTLAMYVGMFAFGAVLGVIARLAGSNLESIRVSYAAIFMLGMGSAMSLTMVAWMRRRHHGWRDCAEMTGRCSSRWWRSLPVTGAGPSARPPSVQLPAR